MAGLLQCAADRGKLHVPINGVQRGQCGLCAFQVCLFAGQQYWSAAQRADHQPTVSVQ